MRFLLSAGITAVLALVPLAETGHAVSTGIFNVSGVQGFNCSACHTDASGASAAFTATPVNPVLPPLSAGYVPGATYDVTVTISGGPGALFGFNWLAQDPVFEPTPTPLGEGIVTDATNTQQASAGVAEFTHTGAGNTMSSWSFQWKAPEGEGTVRFWLSGNSADGTGDTTGDSATAAVSQDVDPIGPEVVARFGNVNGDLDNVVNTLMLNGSPGDDDRKEAASVGGALLLSLDTYPGDPGTIQYALFALLVENGPGDVTPLPMGLGSSAFCFLMPDTKPLVRTVANRLGSVPLLGTGRFNLPAGPGPLINTNVPGSVAGRCITFQALVQDTTSGLGVSLSNAIVMEVP